MALDTPTTLLIGSGMGLFAGIVGAWGGAYIAGRGTRAAQREDRAAQREAQREERKARAYEEILRILWRRQLNLDDTMTNAESAEQLQEGIDSPDTMSAWALVALHGSEAVRERQRAVNAADSQWIQRTWTVVHEGLDPRDDALRTLVGQAMPEAIHALETEMNGELHPAIHDKPGDQH